MGWYDHYGALKLAKVRPYSKWSLRLGPNWRINVGIIQATFVQFNVCILTVL